MIWAILFIGIIVVSFLLALWSMRSYQEQPYVAGLKYSLYLIRRPEGLTVHLLDKLYQHILPRRVIISFERLLKGKKQALVVYGPSTLMLQFEKELRLLELEEYGTNLKEEDILAWELLIKKEQRHNQSDPLFNAPTLEDSEQFWWQICLQPQKVGLEKQVHRVVAGTFTNPTYKIALEREKLLKESHHAYDSDQHGSNYNHDKYQQPQEVGGSYNYSIRNILFTTNVHRKEKLFAEFINLIEHYGLLKVPQSQPSVETLRSYRRRLVPASVHFTAQITGEETLILLGLQGHHRH